MEQDTTLISQLINHPVLKQPDLVIAWTWSPQPHDGTPSEQFNRYLTTLRTLKQCCEKYALYCELNKSGYLHFHGTLQIKDKIRWYKTILPSMRRFGFVLIKPRPDEGWGAYISKEAELMSELLEMELPITQDHILMKAIKKTKSVVKKQISMDILKFCIDSDEAEQE